MAHMKLQKWMQTGCLQPVESFKKKLYKQENTTKFSEQETSAVSTQQPEAKKEEANTEAKRTEAKQTEKKEERRKE